MGRGGRTKVARNALAWALLLIKKGTEEHTGFGLTVPGIDTEAN